MKGKLVQDPLQVNFAHTIDDFAGYCPTQKAYRVYDLDDHCTPTSRDVTFHEHIFPYKDIPFASPLIPMPTPIPDIDSNVQPSSILHHSTLESIPMSLDFVHDTTTVIPEASIPFIPSTRPQTTITKPAWLQNYVCSNSSHSSNLYFPRMLTPAHRLFLANVAAIQEPRSFAQANQIEDWRKAMNLELHAPKQNETWDLTTLPEGKKPIGSRWIYKFKLLLDGMVDSYKARLVAKGYSKIKGIDYFDNFSPVAKIVTVRLFLAIASSHSWPISQLVINNAFLHGYLDGKFMHPLEGYTRAQPGQVCRL
ncbi:UNVERIFIED_CONTAM: hypothetical protein Sangu_2630700 [Sesamum angustifolium]|uniref:Reverse transcriptase Ty1/copia-type domain-containing protein n=1 Tax=Sesamum angustifolium TaxID=2727405 RepID=A0AAW2J633_9LAMI